MKYYTKKTRQAGMTLIELTVVLLVLVGLAGLMIPYVSGFIAKTHDSTGTFNSAAMDNNIQRYIAEKTRLPNNMEALINAADNTNAAADCPAATAGAADAVYCKMMNPGFLGPQDLAGPRLNSLNMAGITDLYYNDTDTDNATFQSTIATPTTLVTASVVAIVGAADGTGIADKDLITDHLAEAFERNANSFDANCYDYVVVGLGEKSDLIGTTMNTAPVHFAQQGAMGPVNKYNRFVAILEVDRTMSSSAATATQKGCTAGMEPARFIGAAMAMGSASGHLFGTSHSLSHTWENIAAN